MFVREEEVARWPAPGPLVRVWSTRHFQKNETGPCTLCDDYIFVLLGVTCSPWWTTCSSPSANFLNLIL